MALVANVMAPYVGWGIGNDTQLSLPYSMMATLLAALVERPFLTMAGFDRLAVVYSIRANILSWAAGVAIVISIGTHIPEVFFLMLYSAVPFSIVIEGVWLASVQKNNEARFHWGPIILGNLLSGIFLLAILVAGYAIGDEMQMRRGRLIRYLAENHETICTYTAVTCVILFSLFLLVPARLFSRLTSWRLVPAVNPDGKCAG